MRATGWGALLLALVLGAGVATMAGIATADDGAGVAEAPAPVPAPPPVAEPPVPPSPGPEGTPPASDTSGSAESEDGATAVTEGGGRIEAALLKDRRLVWLMGLLRFGPALIGVGLLAYGYTLRSRRQAGLLPAAPAPVGATRVASLPEAVLVTFLYVVAPSLVVLAATRAWPAFKGSMVLTLVALVVIAIPLVTGYAMRRRSLRTRAPDAAGKVLGRGFLAFCTGNALAVPALFVGAAVLKSFGVDVTTYQVVEKAVDPTQPANLYVTAILAVIVAPIVEETLFRGLLYPAMRDTVGGGKRGMWVAAILVSALFAAFHQHAPSFLPLFFLAMVFTWVFERTDSLMTVIVAHAFFNAASILPLLLARMQGLL